MIYDINSMRYNDFDKKQIEFLSLLAGELWALFIKISLIYSKPQIQGGPVINSLYVTFFFVKTKT